MFPYWVINADFSEADYISGEVKRGKQTTPSISQEPARPGYGIFP